MILTVVAGAGATAGYSPGDWVLQLAPVAVCVITCVTAWLNRSAAMKPETDPMKLAIANKLNQEGAAVDSVLKRFDMLLDLIHLTMERPQQTSAPGSE